MAERDKPTQEELKRVRKQLLIDKGPSSRAQSYQFVYWRTLGDQLGQPFDSTKIPLSKLYQMRRDPMISFALHYIKVPLLRAPWYIKCDDPQIAAFVDWSLRRIYARLVLQYMQSLDFGFAAVVKRFELANPTGTYIDPDDDDEKEQPIWDEGSVDAVVWKTFVGLPPEQVEPRWTPTGEFNGIRYDTKRDVPLAFPSQSHDRDDGVDVPLDLSLWITNEKDTVFGSPWGYPRIGYAFRYWWSYWYRWALADRHFEKDADPSLIVKYPDLPENELVDEAGNTIDYRELALGIGEQARSGSTIAMPSNTHESEADGRITNVPEWDIKALEGTGNFDVFDKTFERLEVLKLRSVWVPEQAFLEGSGGSSSRNVAKELGNSFEEAQAVLMAEFDDHVNRFVIPQLVHVNFPEFEGECKKVTGGFGSDDMEMAKSLVQLIGQRTPEKLHVDISAILERLGVPILTPSQIKREEEKAMEKALAMQPPPGIEAKPGQAGTVKVPRPDKKPPGQAGRPAGATEGSSKTGFDVKYIKPREVIHLSSIDTFIENLPDTQHYRDRQVVEYTRENRKLWTEIFRDAYNDFAVFVKNTEDFAEEDDDADERARSIVERWAHSLSDAASSARDLLSNIMERAGNAELKRAKYTTDTWSMSDGPAEWAERHAAELIRGVDETVRQELRTFLANEIRAGHSNEEIAENIRSHFYQFPDWKADRVARTETMLAYNFATLYAGQQAGVTRVQALDAQRGPTDEDCERRNGQIFDIEDAFAENLKEHPNGTLSWRLLRQTNLSVSKIPRSDCPSDKLAWFDPLTDTIYMAEDLDPESAERYLCMIGESLA